MDPQTEVAIMRLLLRNTETLMQQPNNIIVKKQVLKDYKRVKKCCRKQMQQLKEIKDVGQTS